MMFDRAYTFVRSNIPDSFVEKATPYYAHAQGIATPYLEQAQTMGHKIKDYAATKSTSLKEQSTTYVNGAAERLDSVLVDNGNKLSSKYLGREVIHFHFKEALAKLNKHQQEQEEAKKEEQQQEGQEGAAAAAASEETKEQAASSVANLFNTISTSSTTVLNNVTTKVTALRTSAQEKVNQNKERLVAKAVESRGVAIKSVAGACTIALKGRDYVAAKQQQYLPEKISTLAQNSLTSLQAFSAPYLQLLISQSKNLDSKFLQGATFSFVEDVNSELFPVIIEEEVSASPAREEEVEQQEEQQQEEVAAPVAAAVEEEVEQEQEQEEEASAPVVEDEEEAVAEE